MTTCMSPNFSVSKLCLSITFKPLRLKTQLQNSIISLPFFHSKKRHANVKQVILVNIISCRMGAGYSSNTGNYKEFNGFKIS